MISRLRSLPAVLSLLGLACLLPEAALYLFPYGELVRGRLIQNFAFWPGLLHGWAPNYPFQPEVMSASSSA